MKMSEYLSEFTFKPGLRTQIEDVRTEVGNVNRYKNEFWTAGQRQANALHEVSYRACFKPQLPAFFIQKLTNEGDTVYDPFAGRGTTLIEAALLNRNVIGNDINPLSRIFTEPRLRIPNFSELEIRVYSIDLQKDTKFNISLSAFYHKDTERELAALHDYLLHRKKTEAEDALDKWIRMVATNRLTGHSPGFFSVYTLPPNQAVSVKRQLKINETRKQTPEYRDVKALILKKSRGLVGDLTVEHISKLKNIGEKAFFLNEDARQTKQITANSVQLTVTSPPFLDVVQYSDDNWLRLLFNGIDAASTERKITMLRSPEQWSAMMQDVFHELFRITKAGGFVAFEVGEVRGGKIELDKLVVPLGVRAGFLCEGIMINTQNFTKTANIWGIENNSKGTNSNRIVIFQK